MNNNHTRSDILDGNRHLVKELTAIKVEDIDVDNLLTLRVVRNPSTVRVLHGQAIHRHTNVISGAGAKIKIKRLHFFISFLIINIIVKCILFVQNLIDSIINIIVINHSALIFNCVNSITKCNCVRGSKSSSKNCVRINRSNLPSFKTTIAIRNYGNRCSIQLSKNLLDFFVGNSIRARKFCAPYSLVIHFGIIKLICLVIHFNVITYIIILFSSLLCSTHLIFKKLLRALDRILICKNITNIINQILTKRPINAIDKKRIIYSVNIRVDIKEKLIIEVRFNNNSDHIFRSFQLTPKDIIKLLILIILNCLTKSI